MCARLQDELKKQHPFRSAEQEAFLNVQRTADALMRDFEKLLKPVNLSPTQYNVLRILRGVGAGASLSCREAAERMVTRDPDMTRLLDRLESRGLITRARDQKDRRIVSTRITKEGLNLLATLDEPTHEMHQLQLAHLGAEKLKQLSDLLQEARDRTSNPCPLVAKHADGENHADELPRAANLVNP